MVCDHLSSSAIQVVAPSFATSHYSKHLTVMNAIIAFRGREGLAVVGNWPLMLDKYTTYANIRCISLNGEWGVETGHG